MKPYAFPKAEHLCLSRDIEQLFSAGSRAATAFPLRAVYRLFPQDEAIRPAVKVLLSVSKRRLHRAVDRNRAKRQLREAYRHHKAILTTALPASMGLNIGFMWLAESPQPSATIDKSVVGLLHRIAEKIEDSSSSTIAP